MNTTNFNSDVVVAAIIGFIIGALLVWIISYVGRKKDKEEDNVTLQALQALQKEYDQYRARVNEHFAKTADSIDGLTKSYQQVFDHLSHGAQNLMDSDALQAQLEKRRNKAVTLAYLVEQERKTKQASQPSAGTAARSTAKPASAPAKPAPQSDAAAVKKQPAAGAPAEGIKETATKETATVDKATPPKSNVHIAAEKAGLKPIAKPDKQAPVRQPELQGKAAVMKQPAPSNESELKNIQDEPHETAVEAVKKHIKEDVDKGSSK